MFEAGSHESNLLAFAFGFALCYGAVLFYRYRKRGATSVMNQNVNKGKNPKCSASTHRGNNKKPNSLEQRGTSKSFTLDELSHYTGVTTGKAGDSDGAPIYISLRGLVYEITSHPSGRDLYGPGGPYHLFAGKDATTALARMSLEASCVNTLDWKTALSEGEKKTLREWVEKFESKYNIIGFVEGICEEEVKESMVGHTLSNNKAKSA